MQSNVFIHYAIVESKVGLKNNNSLVCKVYAHFLLYAASASASAFFFDGVSSRGGGEQIF
jgi:hypothetical protein